MKALGNAWGFSHFLGHSWPQKWPFLPFSPTGLVLLPLTLKVAQNRP